jgi:hypothetical protein
MKTSGNNARAIEQYLENSLAPEDKLLFEARLLTSPLLHIQVQAQRRVYRLVQWYHQKQLRRELEEVHKHIFTAPAHRDFQQRISRLFKH